MTKKFSQARKRAFLTYLAQTGNQTLSAERAKVSRSWVQLHRSGDAAFDAACREAIGRAAEALRDASSAGPAAPDQVRGDARSSRPPAGWGYLDGAELVVGRSNRRHNQVRRARVRQWTPRVEARFLAALAATCNVRAACAEAGMSVGSAYVHRYRWPAFEQRWDEAIETGYVLLEAALIEAGCNLFSDEAPPPTDAEAGEDGAGPDGVRIRAMTADHALQLLHMHKHQVRGLGKRPGSAFEKVATVAEVADALERRLASFRRALERPASAEAQARFGREVGKRRGGP